MNQNRRKKLLIDCDPGCDDALALMYAFGSAELEILAVTTTCGNADITTTTRNAAAILALLKCADVPVLRGAARPLRAALETSVVHGDSGLGDLALKTEKIAKAGAANEICKLARANPGEVTVAALGPLTNLALAFRKDPVGFRKLQELVILGGTAKAPGNKGPVSEFNFFVDPDAAAIVLQSGVPIRLVVLDACYPISLIDRDFGVIKDANLRRLLRKLLKPYVEANLKEEGIGGAIMYDPLVIFSLLSPGATSTTPYRATVEIKGVNTRGMLVIDRRLRSRLKVNVIGVERVNAQRFKRSFFAALNRLALDLKVVVR